MPNKLTLHVNGSAHAVEAEPEQSLLSVLRDDLDLTGTRYGCGEGQCGACTVLVDGQVTRSCITPVSAVGNKAVLTIEGLETNDQLHSVQEAFLAEDALQCGYCTSGMIMASVALLRKKPHPTDQDIVQAMNGNVCRCGTYRRILRAVHTAAQTQTQHKEAK